MVFTLSLVLPHQGVETVLDAHLGTRRFIPSGQSPDGTPGAYSSSLYVLLIHSHQTLNAAQYSKVGDVPVK